MRKFRLCIAAGVSFLLGFAPMAMANETGVTDGEALLITSGDPADPDFANAGANLRTGVGSIFISFVGTGGGGFLCTMSVIDDRYILTAAHCLRNTNPDGSADTVDRLVVILPSGVNYFFDTNAGVNLEFAVNPLYDALNPFVGAFAPGDIAVIKMPFDLPADVERYEMYRTSDEFGQDTRHYGHGVSGKGNKGAVGSSSFFVARTGLNEYEQTLAPFFGSNLFDQLLHDYDSGGSKHNAMAWWFSSQFACAPTISGNPGQAQDGQCTTFKDGSFPDFKGFEKFEVGIAPGDSGGPGFIDGKVAGVHSFGFTHFCTGVTNTTDFSCGLNSSYGEMSGDTRVSSNAGWVDGVIDGSIATTPIPEPVAAASGSGSGSVSVSVSDWGKNFMGNSFSRTLRKPMSFEEFKTEHGID